MKAFMIVLWGVVIIVGIIAELATTQFVSIWFSFAALFSLILAGIGAPLWAQLSVFAAATALLLILTKPLVRKLRGNFVRTNADLNIGKTAIVTEDIDNEHSKGRATVGGVSWIAVSEDGSAISSGESVIIKDIDGAKLIVARKA